MPSSGKLRRVAVTETEVSEKRIASIIRVTRIGELGTSLEIPRNRSILRRNNRLLVTANVVRCSSVLIRATLRNNPEVDILHSYRRENLKSYIALTGWTL
jgi:hypothetical protein